MSLNRGILILSAIGAALIASAPAMAQSSVTLYGVLDVFVGTQVELHYSVGGQPGTLAGNAVYQAGVQTNQGPVYLAPACRSASGICSSVRARNETMHNA